MESLQLFPNSSDVLGQDTTYSLSHIPGVRARTRGAEKEKEATQCPWRAGHRGIPNVLVLGGPASGDPVPNPAGLNYRIKGSSHFLKPARFKLK